VGRRVRRSYKFRLRPTAKQHVALQDCLDVHRALYNAALQERRDAYDRVVKRSPNFFAETRPTAPVSFARQSAQLPAIRAATPEIARFGAGSEQATLRQLVRAFQAFFRRVRGGEEPGYPRFKSADRFDSVTWPAPGDACKWVPDASRVYLQGIGHVKVTMHRDVPGTFKTIQVKREGRRWYLVLSCDDVPVHLLRRGADRQPPLRKGWCRAPRFSSACPRNKDERLEETTSRERDGPEPTPQGRQPTARLSSPGRPPPRR
jgi:putative transposase